MANKGKQYKDDDGHVITNMNVEGMPWYQSPSAGGQQIDRDKYQPISKRDTFYIIMGALKAALLIGLIFAVVLVLFVLFCTNIWLA